MVGILEVADRRAHIVGLLIAYGGPALLLSPADRLLGPQTSMVTKVLELVAMWLFVAAIVAIVIFWEKQPLASMWLRPFSWTSIAWGAAFALVTMYAIMPALVAILRLVHIAGFEAGMAKILVLPTWLRIIGVITAGVVEDTLFLGYGFTRLAMLTGRTSLAGIIAVTLIALLHYPNWGLGPFLAYLVAVGIAIAFFAWRRDLLANIVAHTIVDGMGLVVIPAVIT